MSFLCVCACLFPSFSLNSRIFAEIVKMCIVVEAVYWFHFILVMVVDWFEKE